HAVLHARSHLRPTTDGAGRLLVTLRHRRSVQRTLGAAGQPLDAVGILRRREPAHAGVSPLTRGRYLVKRTLRHPIRGDRLHPKPSSRQPRKSTWNREARQPRMRPRKSVNVASLVGSPEDEPSRPNLRLRVVGIAVLVLFLVLVLRLIGQTPAQVKAAVNNVRYSPYEPVPVETNAPAATVQYLQTHQSDYPGVSVQTITQRTYPQGGTTATHVLGYSGDITSQQLAANPKAGYNQGSLVGQSGIEAEYEPYLRGVNGRQALSVNASGDVVGMLSHTAPQIGDTVVLNIDTGLQEAVQTDLAKQILQDRHTPDAEDNNKLP